jgi:hypothetical protein
MHKRSWCRRGRGQLAAARLAGHCSPGVGAAKLVDSIDRKTWERAQRTKGARDTVLKVIATQPGSTEDVERRLAENPQLVAVLDPKTKDLTVVTGKVLAQQARCRRPRPSERRSTGKPPRSKRTSGHSGRSSTSRRGCRVKVL